MTTSVDILFKELPAPSQASDRISRPDTSPVGSDYGQGRSSVSKQNDDRGYEKSFTAHLEDHDVDGKQPANSKTENKPDYSSGDDHKNENAVQNKDDNVPASVAKPASDKADQNSKNEVKPAIEVDDKKSGGVVAVNAEDTSSPPIKAVQTVTTKDLLIAESVPEKAVASSAENSALNNSKINNVTIPDVKVPDVKAPEVSPAKGLATDVVERPQGSENQDGTKGIQNAALKNNENAKQHSPVFASASATVPTAPETAPQTAVHPTPNGEGQPQTPATIPTKIVTEPVGATQPMSTKVPEGEISGTTPDTRNKNTGISEPLTALQKPIDAETEPQKSGVIISAMATAMKDAITSAPMMEKPVAPPETVTVESIKTLPFALLQSQNNAQKTSPSNKKGGSSAAPTANTKATNMSAAGAANTQSSVATPSLLSATKSDIQLDLGMAGQKFDTPLPQVTVPNGQTSMSTGGLLAAQDVNFQKTVSNLGATMKTDAPLNTKMINEQITVAINKNVFKGLNNFSIRLHPAELGQVDVRLEFMADGRMQAAMTVENEKTLTMLQRDQGMLEKALQDAGINLSNKNMNFSLMKQGQQQNQKFAGFDGTANEDGNLEDLAQLGTMQEIRMGYSNRAIDISV